MKNIFLYLFTILIFSCDSNFNSFPNITNPISRDSDGDPIIDKIQNPETQSFGLENSFCYGFSTPNSYDVADIDTNIVFPSSVDLSSFLPKVRSQGQQGSCVGWAVGYYLKSYQENLEDFNNGDLSFNNEMSPSYIFNIIRSNPSTCGGSAIPSAFERLKNSGITTLEEMPYNENDCDTKPTDAQDTLAQINKIDSFYYLNGELLFDQTKAFLVNEQPVVIAISIDRQYFGAFDNNGDAIYRKFKKVDGAHAVLIVGYDDTKNAFKAVNSWGPQWGNNGFVWIDYKAFQEVLDTESDFKILCEAWVTNDIIDQISLN